ncbi:MAG: tyrosine-type recombinase/integrase [Flavobacteriales bacterium]|nr:tyrosine-type recombinase/integrase [Flavobacteriales bacterium]
MSRVEYLNYIEHEKRYSQHTITSANTDLKQFQKFLFGTFELEDIKDAQQIHVRSWIASLAEKSISNRSIQRKLSSLRSYFKYLKRKGDVKRSPTEELIAPKISEKLPQFVEEQNMLELMFNEEHFENSFEGIRDKLILKLFYSTGMRLSELINIARSDLDLINGSVKVTGKRNKQRVLPISKDLVKDIQRYIDQREKLKEEISVERELFLTKKGKKLYSKLVYRRVNHYLSKVTTLNKKSPHILRHTFATHLLNKGADLNAIKEILGHADLTATQVYTHNSIEKLKNVHEQAHPKG